MLRLFFIPVLLALTLLASSAVAEPVRLILDTDIGNDVDDALALAMIHALENRGEVRLLAVTITKDNRYAAPFVDLVNTFYGRPNIPIGVVHNGKTPDDAPMLRLPAERKDAAGHYVFPHRLKSGTDAPEAVQLLTKILSEQPDHSVAIAQIGFSTNLARLLKTPGGRDLVQRKVKVLSLMAGNFVESKPEFNIDTDPDSARILVDQWPTPMIFSGFEIGLAVTFPFDAIAKDFGYVAAHPIAEAYRLYVKKPEDHSNWDSTAVLEAIRPDRGYFKLSPAGRVTVDAKSLTRFHTDPNGNCRYLILKPEEVCHIRELIATLASEPPQQSLQMPHVHRTTF